MINAGDRILWRKQPCVVVAVGRGPGPRNTLIEFDDGRRVVFTWALQRFAKPVLDEQLVFNSGRTP